MKLRIITHLFQDSLQPYNAQLLHRLLETYGLDYTHVLKATLACWDSLGQEDHASQVCAAEVYLSSLPKIQRKMENGHVDFVVFQQMVNELITAMQSMFEILQPIVEPLVKTRLYTNNAHYELYQFTGPENAAVIQATGTDPWRL